MQEVNLTNTSYIVLGLIELSGEATPYEMKQAAAGSFGNFWSMHHAQFYTEPERLTQAGLLTEERERGGRRRKRYVLTKEGREALERWRAEPTAELGELRDPGLLKLFFGAEPGPLADAQLEAHEAKLAQYEWIRDQAGNGGPAGPRATLEAGIAARARVGPLLESARRIDSLPRVGMAAEPRPASLPLPGGREGATVRLHPLLVARMKGPPAIFHREEGRLAAMRALGVGVSRESYLDVPVIAFLVEHPGAGPVLIDTGFHGSVAIDSAQAMGRFGGLLFKDVQMESNEAVPPQLRARGIAPESVGTIVMTHLHSDHASGIAHFPEATFVISADEWESARKGSQLEGYLKRQYDHAFDYRLVDFDGAGAGSFATFGRALDLFGDGSVQLVSTPGHTEGHLSVVLRLAHREALIAGDALYTMRTLRERHLPYRMADEHRFERSLREIELYTEQTPDALVIPGHDMPAWRTLDTVY